MEVSTSTAVETPLTMGRHGVRQRSTPMGITFMDIGETVRWKLMEGTAPIKEVNYSQGVEPLFTLVGYLTASYFSWMQWR